MRFHRLRVAWSAAWGIIGLLIVAAMLRSFVSIDELFCSAPKTSAASIVVARGEVRIRTLPNPENRFLLTGRSSPRGQLQPFRLPMRFQRLDGGVIFPLWLLLLVTLALGSCPWAHKAGRFSLRTLLIATTLVAVVLGLIVWLQ